MDWQQGTKTKLEGLDPLPWLNQLHWGDMEQRDKNKRALIFSRFGGVGSGRYPIGFSGDAFSDWQTLAYQIYFTATASNVLYGYWSHDIGGHLPGAVEPEMYTRWIQFGAFSPILRSHSTKKADADRRIWEHPAAFYRLMLQAIERRYEMVPYIYGENRKAMDTGISLLRPMYYNWPKEKDAYTAKGQFMFGDSMLVAPVASAMGEDQLSSVRVWLPKGEWIDTATGDCMKGNKWYTRGYLLEEVPAFVRPGTILPLQKKVNRLQPGSYRDLILEVYPGADCKTSLYEDDGVSQGYLQGESAEIPLSLKSSSGKNIITIGKAKGTFDGFLGKRSLTIRLMQTSPAKTVTVGNRPYKWSRTGKPGGWHYDADNAAVIIQIPTVNVRNGITITVTSDPQHDKLTDGFRGLMRRMELVRSLTNMICPPGEYHSKEHLACGIAQTGNRISREPSTFSSEIAKCKKNLKKLPAMLKSYATISKKRNNTSHLQSATNALKLFQKIKRDF